jgi:Adenylosuccinate lyase C-terminal
MSYSRINQNAEKIAAPIVKALGVAEPTDDQIFKWFARNFDYRFKISAIDLSKHELSGMIHENGPKGSFKILVEKSEPFERQREGISNPYELLKDLTRTNQKITNVEIHKFIDTLEVSDKVKNELKKITPQNYTGKF